MTTPDSIKIINDKTLEVKELTVSQKSKFVLALDSTQGLEKFKRCEQEWNYSDRQQLEIIAPWRENKAMKMGSLGHKYLDSFYKSRALGTDFLYAVNTALAYNYKEDPDLNTLSVEDAIKVRDRTRMYFNFHNDNNDFIATSPEHVEVGFSELLYEDCERIYILEGRIDLIGSIQNIPVVVDHKYQLTASDIYKKTIQFRNYAMVTKMTTLVINYIRLAASPKEGPFLRTFAPFTLHEHREWKERLIRIYNKVYDRLVHENGIFDLNESACSGKYGQCEFTTLCEELNEAQRETKKASLYQIKKLWKPW